MEHERVLSTKGKLEKTLNDQTKCNICLYFGTTQDHNISYILRQREYPIGQQIIKSIVLANIVNLSLKLSIFSGGKLQKV